MSKTNGNIPVVVTKPQWRALNKLQVDKWQSAYELQESRAVLNALVRKELAIVKYDLGHIFSPRTSIYYRRKK